MQPVSQKTHRKDSNSEDLRTNTASTTASATTVTMEVESLVETTTSAPTELTLVTPMKTASTPKAVTNVLLPHQLQQPLQQRPLLQLYTSMHVRTAATTAQLMHLVQVLTMENLNASATPGSMEAANNVET